MEYTQAATQKSVKRRLMKLLILMSFHSLKKKIKLSDPKVQSKVSNV